MTALVAVLTSVLLSVAPGTAAAYGSSVSPLVDCYAQNTDGSITVVLGYRSTYSYTKTIPRGSNNYVTPSTYTSQLPTVFKSGEQHGVLKLTISRYDLYNPNLSWYLDGNTLSYYSAAQTAGVCSSAQLPALANGGALMVVLVLAAAVGALMVRQARRATTPPALPPAERS